jgi:hypothetical protein
MLTPAQSALAIVVVIAFVFRWLSTEIDRATYQRRLRGVERERDTLQDAVDALQRDCQILRGHLREFERQYAVGQAHRPHEGVQ